jgi:hypothetical protein
MVKEVLMVREALSRCALAAAFMLACASPSHAQRYVSTEVAGGGVVLHSPNTFTGWYIDLMKSAGSAVPHLGIVGEALGFYGSIPSDPSFHVFVGSAGIRGRFGEAGPNAFVQLLVGRIFSDYPGGRLVLTPGGGFTFPIDRQWAVRVRADWHLESEGAAGVLGVAVARQWGAR